MGLKSDYKLSKNLPPTVNFQCTYTEKKYNSTEIQLDGDMKKNNYMDNTKQIRKIIKLHNQQPIETHLLKVPVTVVMRLLLATELTSKLKIVFVRS